MYDLGAQYLDAYTGTRATIGATAILKGVHHLLQRGLHYRSRQEPQLERIGSQSLAFSRA